MGKILQIRQIHTFSAFGGGGGEMIGGGAPLVSRHFQW
jgi:hypothetical protein